MRNGKIIVLSRLFECRKTRKIPPLLLISAVGLIFAGLDRRRHFFTMSQIFAWCQKFECCSFLLIDNTCSSFRDDVLRFQQQVDRPSLQMLPESSRSRARRPSPASLGRSSRPKPRAIFLIHTAKRKRSSGLILGQETLPNYRNLALQIIHSNLVTSNHDTFLIRWLLDLDLHGYQYFILSGLISFVKSGWRAACATTYEINIEQPERRLNELQEKDFAVTATAQWQTAPDSITNKQQIWQIWAVKRRQRELANGKSRAFCLRIFVWLPRNFQENLLEKVFQEPCENWPLWKFAQIQLSLLFVVFCCCSFFMLLTWKIKPRMIAF